MAPHSITPAWKIPWMEEPGRLQSMGSLRVGHDWVTSLSLFTFMHWKRKWQPTPVFLPGESQGRGSLVACRLWGSHRVRHNWSDLAVYVCVCVCVCVCIPWWGTRTLIILHFFFFGWLLLFCFWVPTLLWSVTVWICFGTQGSSRRLKPFFLQTRNRGHRKDLYPRGPHCSASVLLSHS